MTSEAPKIVLTGGPCSGKTSALAYLKRKLPERKIYPLIVPESATLLMGQMNLPKPASEEAGLEFQKWVLQMQLHNEDLAQKAVKKLLSEGKKPVIIHDRGILDGLAYTDQKSFEEILKKFGLSLSQVRKRYDAVISLAVAPENYFTVENNSARSEDYGQACALGDKVLKAWTGVSPLWTVNNPPSGFNAKVSRVFNYVLEALGEPPVERERKFIVQEINLKALKAVNPVVFKIEQHYLESPDGISRRVRKKTSSDGHIEYYFTEKRPTDDPSERIEIERSISESEYLRLLKEKDPRLFAIQKTRYCFVYEGVHWELDIFEEGHQGVIFMECELPKDKMDKDLQFPPFVKVYLEDKDGSYSNSQLANPEMSLQDIKAKIIA